MLWFSLLALHAPATDRAALDGAEDDVLDHESDQDHGEEAGEHIRNLELVLVLVDEPAEATGPGRHAEHQLGGDQRPPREGPADLEAGQDARERGRDQDSP